MVYQKIVESGVRQELTVAATGDSLLSKRLSVYEEERFLSLIKILREADVAFTNLEGLIHELKDGYPGRGLSRGTYQVAEPFAADELKWAGFDLLSVANNHSLDYSVGGLLACMKILDKAGLVHAGAGVDLGEAREPAYLETKKGTVALTAMHSTVGDSFERAGEIRSGVNSRPGVNGFRYSTKYMVSSSSFEALKKITAELKLRPPMWGEPPKDEVSFLQNSFKVGAEPEILLKANESDVKANLRSIQDARAHSDWVLVSFHCHQHEMDQEAPPRFLTQFAHDCIDTGADAFIGHGEHAGMGMEIYKGKPIFYSLGTFMIQSGAVRKYPADAYEAYGLDEKATPSDWYNARQQQWKDYSNIWWYNTVVASFTLKSEGLTALKLYPVSTGLGKGLSQIGRPFLADEEQARKTIERYARLSSPFGTHIEFKDGIGIVKV